MAYSRLTQDNPDNALWFVLYSDLGKDGLRAKSLELWDNVVRLETEKYDLEERQRRQGYDVS